MKKIPSPVALGAVFGLLSAPFALAEDNCASLSLALRDAITAKPADLLQLVEAKVSASPGCSCEVVKTAIEVTQADAKTVAAIVEAASSAAPDHMRLIAQCALAVAPDALADVQAVLAELDPSGGKSGNSAKDSKDAKEAQVTDTWNPLDEPGDKHQTPKTSGDPLPPGLPTGDPPIIPSPPPIGSDTRFRTLR
jgi:hypothetical protein